MTRLADQFKELSEAPPRPMGFRAATAARAKRPPMLLLAEAPNAAAAKDALAAGAGGVLVGGGTADDVLAAVKEAAGDGVWGVVVEQGGKDGIERLKAGGAAFALVRDISLPADTLEPEEIDRVLEVDPAWSDMILRGADGLSFTALLYRFPEAASLTIEDLLQCRRVSSLVRKHLIAALPAAVGTEALAALRDAGVTAVLVPADAAARFREAVDALPPAKKPDEHFTPTLPSAASGGGHEHHEHDDDDDDDE